MKKLIIGAVLSMTTLPAISHAGFLNNLEGLYKVSGKKCQFGDNTKITGRATIHTAQSGAMVSVEVIIGNFQTDIPFYFKNGSGDEKSTKMEGDIIPLPVTRRTVWNTDESARKSVLTQYEGVGFAKQTGASMLSESTSGELVLKLKNADSGLIECALVKK